MSKRYSVFRQATIIITRAEARIAWEAISSITKRNYSYPQTFDGKYLISGDNLLFVVSVDYNRPRVHTVFRIDENYKNSVYDAKERLIDAFRGLQSEEREAVHVFEKMQGTGYIQRYDFEAYRAYGRENGRRKGKNSRRAYFDVDEELNFQRRKGILVRGE